jgi:NAD(P)-dependent dehydrogenase (short-subunit alcohol dehydrogenase family)
MSTPPPLPWRNAVLTGACGGLGQALARALIEGGARVALVGLDPARLAALAALAPGRCTVYCPDVSDPAAMQALAADWLARHGMPELVIANAGVAGGYDAAEADDLPTLRRMLEINLFGVAATFQPFLAAQRVAGGRLALVGIASVAGWRGLPGNAAYCASKGGLIRYLQSLRADCRGTAVTVHTAHFGYLRTALTAGNRFAMPGLLTPEHAAQALLAALARGREDIVLPRRIGWLAAALAALPARWYDVLLRRQPRKPRPGEPGATPIPGLPPRRGDNAGP